jgi:hypothetical protein
MKDDDYTLLVFLNDVIIAILDCSLFLLFMFQDLTATGTVYIDDNLSFEYRDSMRYNYVSLVSYGNIIVYSSIDDSDSEDFDLNIAEIITVTSETVTFKTYLYL